MAEPDFTALGKEIFEVQCKLETIRTRASDIHVHENKITSQIYFELIAKSAHLAATKCEAVISALDEFANDEKLMKLMKRRLRRPLKPTPLKLIIGGKQQ